LNTLKLTSFREQILFCKNSLKFQKFLGKRIIKSDEH